MTRKQRILTTTAITAFALTATVIAYDHATGKVPSLAPAAGAQVNPSSEHSNTSSVLLSDAKPVALAVDASR